MVGVFLLYCFCFCGFAKLEEEKKRFWFCGRTVRLERFSAFGLGKLRSTCSNARIEIIFFTVPFSQSLLGIRILFSLE